MNFYRPLYKNQVFIIYDSEENALKAMSRFPVMFDKGNPHYKSFGTEETKTIAAVLRKAFDSQVFVSKEGELLFLIEKIETTFHEIWHVIVGERAGWVVMPDWIVMEAVE
jgi:hypothetical protein